MFSSSSSSSTNFITTQVLKQNSRAAMCHVLHYSCNVNADTFALLYDLRNISVFSARLNAPSDGSDVIASGSAFQIFAAATGKARSPMVLCNNRGTCSDGDDADRRRLRDSWRLPQGSLQISYIDLRKWPLCDAVRGNVSSTCLASGGKEYGAFKRDREMKGRKN